MADHPFVTLNCAHCGEPLRVKLGCGDRTCPECRLRWFGYHFQPILDIVSSWPAVYFLTLTIKNIPQDLFSRAHVRELRDNFSKLRRRVRFEGGFYVVQVTNHGKGWHLHFHVLFDGHYLPQDALRRIWLEITGDSFGVDIQRVNNPKAAVRYLLLDFLQAPRIRPEDGWIYNSIFKGSRLVQPFGRYKNVRLKNYHLPFKCPKCGCDVWLNLDRLLAKYGPAQAIAAELDSS